MVGRQREGHFRCCSPWRTVVKQTFFFAKMDRLPYLSVAIFLIHTDLFSSITLKTLICVFSAGIEGRVYSFKLQGVR